MNKVLGDRVLMIKGPMSAIGISAMFVEAFALSNGDLHTGSIAFLVMVFCIIAVHL